MTTRVTRSRAKGVATGEPAAQIKTETLDEELLPEMGSKERNGNGKRTSGKRKRDDQPAVKFESGDKEKLVIPSPKRTRKEPDGIVEKSESNEGRSDVAQARIQSPRRSRTQALNLGRKRSNAVVHTQPRILRTSQMRSIADELFRRREAWFTTDLEIIKPVRSTESGESSSV